MDQSSEGLSEWGNMQVVYYILWLVKTAPGLLFLGIIVSLAEFNNTNGNNNPDDHWEL
jgi:hypothetical protein